MDYAKIDQDKILSYLESNGGSASVDKIIMESGAESLRVYPLIYRLKAANILRITEYNTMGAPITVNLFS